MATITERIVLEGGDEVKAQLDQIGKSGSEALKDLGTGAGTGEGFTTLAGSLGGLKESLAAVGPAIAQFGEASQSGSSAALHLADAVASISSGGLGSLKESFASAATAVKEFGQSASAGLLGIAAVAAGAGLAIVGLANSASAAALEVRDTAAAVGLDAKSWQELTYAAEQAGVEQDTLTAFFQKGTDAAVKFAIEKDKAFKTFQEEGSGWAAGDKYNKTIAELTEKLGIFGGTAEEQKGRLLDLADTIAAIGDPTQQMVAAIVALGENLGPKLLPLLQLGRSGIADYVTEFQESGRELTQQQLDIASAEQTAITNLKKVFSDSGAAISDFRRQLGFLFAPVVTAGANWLTDTLTGWQTAIASFASEAIPRAVSALKDLVAALSGGEVKNEWIGQVATAVQGVGAAIETVVSGAFQTFLGVLDSAAAKLNEVFGTDFSGKSVVLAAAVGVASASFGELGAAVGIAIELFAPFGAEIGRAVPIINDFIAALSGREADIKNPWVIEWTAAFERLGAAISGAAAGAFRDLARIGAEISEVFGPGSIGAAVALTGAVAGLTGGFGLFSAAITAAGAVFALLGGDISSVVPVINDFVSALTGHAEEVAHPWVLDWLAAIETFGAEVKGAIGGFVIPAFHALVDAASDVAKTINSVLGTNFTGAALATAAAIFYLTGGFGFLKTAVIGIGGILLEIAAGLGLAGRAGGAFAEVLAVVGIGVKGIAPEVRATTSAVAEQRGAIAGISDLFASFGTSIANVGRIIGAVIGPAFLVLSGAAEQLGRALSAVFGEEITRNQVLIAALILDLVGGFKLLALAIVPVTVAFGILEGISAAFTGEVLIGAIAKIARGFTFIAIGAGSAAIAVIGAIGEMIAGLVSFGIAAAIAGGWPLAIVAGAALAGAAIYLFWDTIKASAAAAWDYVKAKAQESWDFVKGLFSVGSAQAAESPLSAQARQSQKDADAIKTHSKSVGETLNADLERIKQGALEKFTGLKLTATGALESVVPVAQNTAAKTVDALHSIGTAAAPAFAPVRTAAVETGGTIETYLTGKLKGAVDWFNSLGTGSSQAAGQVDAAGKRIVEVIRGSVSQFVNVYSEGGDQAAKSQDKIPEAAGRAGRASVEIIRGNVSQTVNIYREGADEAAKSQEKIAAAAEEASRKAVAAAQRAKAAEDAAAKSPSKGGGGPFSTSGFSTSGFTTSGFSDQSGFTTSGFSPSGFARGGHVQGPGTGTSDSIPARLSHGEYVVPADAVRSVGVPFLDSIKNLRGFAAGGLASSIVDSIKNLRQGFAIGGLVGAYAGGGAVLRTPAASAPSGRGLTLVLGGREFGGLTGPSNVLNSLEKHAVLTRLSATTKRSPSRVT